MEFKCIYISDFVITNYGFTELILGTAQECAWSVGAYVLHVTCD